jgi:hypothetical protein
MKIYYKMLLIILLISLFPLSAVHAESIKDNTYVVLIQVPNRIWIDQFEFDAGDVYRAYTTKRAQLTGTWIETELIDTQFFSLTWFQAFVEKEEEPTTTTTTTVPEVPQLPSSNLVTSQQVKYDINIWGFAYIFTIPLLAPDGTELSIGLSLMTGYGAYLGADSTFWGLAGFTGGGGGGGTPAFGSISPDSGQKESTLTAVEITGENTTFQDDGVNSIIFSPDDGLTISNISVQNNTTVRFDLEISASASTGSRSVIVTYDNFTKVITGESVFEVTE